MTTLHLGNSFTAYLAAVDALYRYVFVAAPPRYTPPVAYPCAVTTRRRCTMTALQLYIILYIY
jgi:hypothetical protein